MARKVTLITKEAAATRQLVQAIRLFFQCGDMLSVHTLAAASYQLLADLAKRQGVVSSLRGHDRIRPERMKEWLAALARTENFLKHADRDPDQAHEYVEESTIFLLFEAVEIAAKLVRWESKERRAFEWWFVFSFPDLMDVSFLESVQRMANEYGIDPTNRDNWHQWLSKA